MFGGRAHHVDARDAVFEFVNSQPPRIGQDSTRVDGLQHKLAAVSDEVAPKFYASDKILYPSTLWGRVAEYDLPHHHYRCDRSM